MSRRVLVEQGGVLVGWDDVRSGGGGGGFEVCSEGMWWISSLQMGL